MKINLSILFLIFFLLSTSLLYVYALNSDGTALLLLTKHWKLVPPSIKSSWNSSDTTPCSWVGVHCNHHNTVNELNFSSFQISGQLGPQIASLTHLQSIDFSNNSFSGSIPSELGNCSSLNLLDLAENSFTGEIPQSIGELHKLEFLSFFSNSLTGTIPESLAQIPFLTSIYLGQNNLSGEIPAVIGKMSHLEVLSLESNQLSGTIPFSIGKCTSLQELYLNNNLFVGSLPDSLNNLKQLFYLDVSTNLLTGRIPFGGIGSCKKLETIVLSYNRFNGSGLSGLGNCKNLNTLAAINCSLAGPIPSSLGQLTKLEILYLSENQLSGAIPPELGKCTALVDLRMSKNQLEGEIPSELGKLNGLQNLWLFTNNLSGEIPISIWKIQTLQNLIVYENNLSGELPDEITELKQLSSIYLFDNQFTGAIPQGLGINSSLSIVDFTRNKFTGPIPPNLCFRKKLTRLILGQNHFRGSISSDIGSCFTLIRLILKQNNLTGVLPHFVVNPNLSFMDLSNNSISGSLPSSLEYLTNISSINLSSNKLIGNVPHELGKLVNLEVLSLSHNGLEGELPSLLSSCGKLLKLDMSYNMLNGTIPTSFRSLTELSILDLSENRFHGGIPTFLFQLGKLSNLNLGANLLSGEIMLGLEIGSQSLTFLNLSNNNLTGHVPEEMRKLTMLEQLDICCNNFSGNLEVLDGLKSLVEFNVSYNAFSGHVPPSLVQLLVSSPSSFIHNSDLCVNCPAERGERCSGNITFRSCNQVSEKGQGLKHIHIAMMISAITLLLIVLILGISYVLLRHKQHERDFIVSDEASSLLNQVMEATENLNNKHIIGKGAHGTVYKAALGPNKVYALKKIACVGFRGGNTSMVREIQTIGKVRHRNLIRLEDFWLRKEYGLILYTYMENGSLHDILHGTNPLPLLEWNIRYNIALGTAQGLSYLHFDCVPAIVHRDIKPMNILLDKDFEPHISDFGIAMLLDESVAAAQSSTLKGTIGYMAPEMAFSTRNTMESDVYAYGIVLLELITRKKVLDPSFGRDVDIMRWAKSLWNETEDIEAIVDSTLVDEFIDLSIKEQVKDVFLLALRCTEKEAGLRPSMREIVKNLEPNLKSGSKCSSFSKSLGTHL